MRLLDTFCGAGGCSMGYHRAGFEVMGVDIEPQKHYPFEFVQGDAIEYIREHGHEFDVIHASPPCQRFTKYQNVCPERALNHPNLIPQTREALKESGKLYIIENVPRAPLLNFFVLCGSMFGLDVRRHRLFESQEFFLAPQCNHSVWLPNRFPGGRSKERGGSNKALVRNTVEIGAWDISLEIQSRAMDIDWMTGAELSQAIPPAYTEWIGRQLIAMSDNV